MSNKRFERLWEIEQIIRKAKPGGMKNGVLLKIEYITGFELFNTRPYHNYETWSQGWRITDPENDIRVEKEDLDDAIKAWLREKDHDIQPGR